MAREDTAFTEFVATRSVSLLRTAYLLTGDRYLAEDLLQTALSKAYPLWGGIREPRAAESYVRKAMVRTLISWRKRSAWTRETVAAAPPDTPAAPSDMSEARRVRAATKPSAMKLLLDQG